MAIFSVVLWLSLMYLRLHFCGFMQSGADVIVSWHSFSNYSVKLSCFLFCHLHHWRHPTPFLLENDRGVAQRKFVYFLLLLSGDIQVHPGPVESLCGVCSHVVSDFDAALCCNRCDQWIHISCEPNVSLDFYNELVAHPVDDLWFCLQCVNETTDEAITEEVPTTVASSSTHMNFHCAYLNARSIINFFSALVITTYEKHLVLTLI